MLRFISQLILIVGSIVWTHIAARAELVLSLGNANLVAGGTGTIDLFVASQSGTTNLALFNFEIAISGFHSSGSLEFAPDASQSPLVQSVSQPIPYVFLNNTFQGNFAAARQDPDKLKLVGSDTVAIGGDVLNFDNVTIGTTPLLLSRITLQHITPDPLFATGIYTIQFQNNSNTIFSDKDGTPINLASESYTNSGTVSITAVPEPTSLILGLSSSLLLLFIRNSRKLHPSRAPLL